MSELTEAEQVAIATAFNGKALSEAKSSIKDGASHVVDVTVRVTGKLTRGMGKAAGTSEAEAEVDLFSEATVVGLLVRLGIGKKRLAAALKATVDESVKKKVKALGGDSTHPLIECFEKAKQEAQKRLPKRQTETKARAGSLSSTMTVEKV